LLVEAIYLRQYKNRGKQNSQQPAQVEKLSPLFGNNEMPGNSAPMGIMANIPLVMMARAAKAPHKSNANNYYGYKRYKNDKPMR
jgi:hypothetical protein